MHEKVIDNFEEYAEPTLYDKENEDYTSDVRLLEKWASKTDGVIIDLACGAGRATIPLASKGHQLIGVDLHPRMLSEAKKKAAELDLPIKWVEQDCTKLDLKTKSKFIYMVGNSFQHFLNNDDQDALLQSVNRHLEMLGIFLFGTRFPNAEELLSPNGEEYWRTYVDSETNNKVEVYMISSYDALKQIQHNTTIRKFKDSEENLMDEVRTNISLRFVFPKEMERILATNGFEIIGVYRDWEETPINEESNEMIYVCKKIKSY